MLANLKSERQLNIPKYTRMSTRTAHDQDTELIHICKPTLATTILLSLLGLSLRIYMYVFRYCHPHLFLYFLSTPPSLLCLSNHHIACLCYPFLFLVSLPSYFVYHSLLYITYADEVTRLMRLVRCAATWYCACNLFSFRSWRHQEGRQRCTQ